MTMGDRVKATRPAASPDPTEIVAAAPAGIEEIAAPTEAVEVAEAV